MTSAPIISSELWKCVRFSVPHTVIAIERFHFTRAKLQVMFLGAEKKLFATGPRQQHSFFHLLTGCSTFLNFCVSE